MRARISILLKDDVPDHAGETIKHRLFDMGTSDVRRVRVGKVVDLEFDGGDESTISDRVKKLCQDLLVNGEVEDYSVVIEEN